MLIKSITRPWQSDTTHRHNHRNGDRSFYSSKAWKETRNAFIKANPKCCECGGKATVADHKIRIKEGGSPLDWNNLAPMCAPCHNKKDNNAGRNNEDLR